MADTLVGRSHCCGYPPMVRELPVLSRPKVDPEASGGEIDREVRALMGRGESVYRIHRERLEALRPDVVVTQDHCDACAVSLDEVKEAVACAELAGAEVCSLHPHDLDGVRGDFRSAADALGLPGTGEASGGRVMWERRKAVRITAPPGSRPPGRTGPPSSGSPGW